MMKVNNVSHKGAAKGWARGSRAPFLRAKKSQIKIKITASGEAEKGHQGHDIDTDLKSSHSDVRRQTLEKFVISVRYGNLRF